MDRMTQILAGAAIAAGLAAAPAQAYQTPHSIDVTAQNGGFLVADGGGFGARGMWCAAAQYASNVAGASGTQRIYVAKPANRSGVLFTLNPRGLQPKSVSITGASIRTRGANLSVDHAIQFCSDFRLINNR